MFEKMITAVKTMDRKWFTPLSYESEMYAINIPDMPTFDDIKDLCEVKYSLTAECTKKCYHGQFFCERDCHCDGCPFYQPIVLPKYRFKEEVAAATNLKNVG